MRTGADEAAVLSGRVASVGMSVADAAPSNGDILDAVIILFKYTYKICFSETPVDMSMSPVYMSMCLYVYVYMTASYTSYSIFAKPSLSLNLVPS